MVTGALEGIYNPRESESVIRLLLEQITQKSTVDFILDSQMEISPEQTGVLEAWIERLQRHEPVQYVLGTTEFFGLTLRVEPGVLIPRGETEELVQWILNDYKNEQIDHTRSPLRILDIGCGSGAIAIALSCHIPGADVRAADISERAIQLTLTNDMNAAPCARSRIPVQVNRMDILHPVPLPDNRPFDLIVSNPPYVLESRKEEMDRRVTVFEPPEALFVPDADPLKFYRAIARFATTYLTKKGYIYLEINEDFGREVVSLFKSGFSEVILRQDIHGKDRMIRIYNG
ncbi:MAG: peptide chain release factor N(5)-glutamine methyltransferase [Bacteroidales bacterium]|nr:peptide chain release factor N(5)-glutamine methyltransferase [Bacteroidales bacterium]